MTLFGIGPFELVVVLIIALIFLGPEKLPEVARALGKAVHQLQQMAEPYREELTRAIQPVHDVVEPMNTIRQQWQNPLETAKKALLSGPQSADDEPPRGTNAGPDTDAPPPAAVAADSAPQEPRIRPPIMDAPADESETGEQRDDTAR